MNDKRLQVDPIAPQSQLVGESSQFKRGLDMLMNMDFIAITPAAILIHNGHLLVVEDSTFRQDKENQFSYWDDERPRRFVIHRFTLEHQKYRTSTLFSLGPVGGETWDRNFFICEDHLIVRELYRRNSSRTSLETLFDAEHVFSLDGTFVTVLTNDAVLRRLYRQEGLDAQAVYVTDDRFKVSGSVVSTRLGWLYPVGNDDDDEVYEIERELWPFIDAREVIQTLLSGQSTRYITATALPGSLIQQHREVAYPDVTFWEVKSPPLTTDWEVSVSLAKLHQMVQFPNHLIVDNSPFDWFPFQIHGESAILFGGTNASTGIYPKFLTYCWVERDRIEAIHFLQPIQEIDKLNQHGNVEFTIRDLHGGSQLHDGMLYIVCDEKYSETSAIVAFDVRTSTTSLTVPKVPKHSSVMNTHS